MSRVKLRQAAKMIRPSSFLDHKNYFESLYRLAKDLHVHYSYREFASDLGFAATNIMHQIVKGHRPLTTKATETIAVEIGLKSFDRKYLLNLVEYNNAFDTDEREKFLESLLGMKRQILPSPMDQDMLQYYSEWHHSIVREMVQFSDFKADPQWISDKLIGRISPDVANYSLELLKRLKLIHFDEKKQSFVVAHPVLSTGQEIRGMAFVNFHHQMIDLGLHALNEVTPDKRDISGVTICVSQEAVQRLKGLVHDFQQVLLTEERNSTNRDQVYQVNIQLFPLTRCDEKKEPLEA